MYWIRQIGIVLLHWGADCKWIILPFLKIISDTCGGVALWYFQVPYMYLTNWIDDVLATEEERRSKSLTSSQNSSEMWAGLSPTAKRKRMDLEKLEEEASELLSYFNDRNIDALLRVTRHALETIRKRIHASSTINFLGGCIVVHCSFRLNKEKCNCNTP